MRDHRWRPWRPPWDRVFLEAYLGLRTTACRQTELLHVLRLSSYHHPDQAQHLYLSASGVRDCSYGPLLDDSLHRLFARQLFPSTSTRHLPVQTRFGSLDLHC